MKVGGWTVCEEDGARTQCRDNRGPGNLCQLRFQDHGRTVPLTCHAFTPMSVAAAAELIPPNFHKNFEDSAKHEPQDTSSRGPL